MINYHDKFVYVHSLHAFYSTRISAKIPQGMACTGRASIDLTAANEIAKFIPFPQSQCQPNPRTGIALGTRLGSQCIFSRVTGE